MTKRCPEELAEAQDHLNWLVKAGFLEKPHWRCDPERIDNEHGMWVLDLTVDSELMERVIARRTEGTDVARLARMLVGRA